MANAARIRVEWSGVVGPGVSTFYAQEADAAAALAAVAEFFDDIASLIVPSVTWTFPDVGDVIDISNGQIVGSWSGSSVTPFSGEAGATTRAAGVGAYVRWETPAIVNGRRVRGRTFITELNSGGFENDGTLSSTTLTTLRTAADTLAGLGLICVYSPTTSGLGTVSSAVVPDRITALRSRRL